jgi:hypothetical protein
MVEPDGRNSIFVEGAISDSLDQGGFSCILKSDYCDFEFFVEELSLNPVKYFIKKSNHL